MTVSSSTRRAGPFSGNGVTTAFSFTFKVFAASGVAVYLTGPDGVQALLESGYTVALNGDQDASPGGTITYPTAGSPLAAGDTLDVIGDLDFTQGTDLTNTGRFLPQVIEDALDRLTIFAQQLLERAARTLVFPIGETTSVTLPSKADRIGALLTFDETGAPAAGPSIAFVGTVTANVGSINAVGASIGNVNAVADALPNVAAVAGNAANVNTVGGAIGNVNAVGTDIASVNSAAANMAAIIAAPAQALAAATAKTGAETARTAAESARDTALAAAKMYATTAAALADGTLAVNAYFTTPSAVVGEAAILYQKVAGPAATDTGIRIPSAALVPQFLPPESGYVWALLDTNGRTAIRIGADGTVEMPKYEYLQYVAKYLNPESGYVWAVVDQSDKIALALNSKGEILGTLPDGSVALPKLSAAVQARLPASASMSYLQQPSADLWAIGDSLTEFDTWVERIPPYLNTARSITRIGQGGQNSAQLAARAAASFALLTITGNQIPASGAVTITAVSNSLMSCYLTSGTTNMNGWLAGVYGTLTCTHSASGDAFDTYSFTRAANGTAISCPAKAPFVPDIATDLPFRTLVIFVGRNNIGSDPLTAILNADVDAMVALQKAVEKRFLIITPPLGGPLTSGQSTTEGVGSANYNRVVAYEDWATAKYGDRVIKLRELCFQFGNGGADDNDDIAKGVVPRSIRADAVHFNSTGYGYVAQLIANEINRRSW